MLLETLLHGGGRSFASGYMALRRGCLGAWSFVAALSTLHGHWTGG